MAADLHIHVMTDDMTERDIACINACVMGSKYFNLRQMGCIDGGFINNSCGCPHWERVFNEDSVDAWIGEVSWLKAALMEDLDTYVPDTVGEISELIGEDLPVLDEELITKIVAAFGSPNTTGYNLAEVNEVEDFLRKHIGKRVFTVSH